MGRTNQSLTGWRINCGPYTASKGCGAPYTNPGTEHLQSGRTHGRRRASPHPLCHWGHQHRVPRSHTAYETFVTAIARAM